MAAKPYFEFNYLVIYSVNILIEITLRNTYIIIYQIEEKEGVEKLKLIGSN